MPCGARPRGVTARVVLSLLCAAGAPPWAQPATALTVVYDAAGLRNAIAGAAQHIEIQQHLGFLQAVANAGGEAAATFEVLAGTQSIRVRRRRRQQS